jgi:hypothetical protein
VQELKNIIIQYTNKYPIMCLKFGAECSVIVARITDPAHNTHTLHVLAGRYFGRLHDTNGTKEISAIYTVRQLYNETEVIE